MFPSGFKHDLHAFDEVIDVGHVGEHVIAQQQIGLLPFGGQFTSGLLPKNFMTVGTPLCMATSATLAAGSMPRTGSVALQSTGG
jgi:hypothetical protein